MRADAMDSKIDEADVEDRIGRSRAALAAQFHIDSAYVGIPKLARVLGLAPSTIYGLIRSGDFCLPHRTVGSSILVSMDDVARWHCSGQDHESFEPTGLPLRRATLGPFAAGEETHG